MRQSIRSGAILYMRRIWALMGKVVSSRALLLRLFSVLGAFISPIALACSFAPVLAPFAIDKNAGPLSSPPTTEFRLKSLTRGYDDGQGGSCSDAGQISFQAINPPADTGFLFEVEKGSFPDQIFWPRAVKPSNYAAADEYSFVWFDLADGAPRPIDVVVKITPVARDGSQGEPFFLEVRNQGENYEASPLTPPTPDKRTWWCKLTFGLFC